MADVCKLNQQAATLFAASASAGPDYVLGYMNAGMLQSSCGSAPLGAKYLAAALRTDCLSGWSKHRRQTCVREVAQSAAVAAQLLEQAAHIDDKNAKETIILLRPSTSRAHALICLMQNEQKIARHERASGSQVKSKLLHPGYFVPGWGRSVYRVDEECLVRGQGCPAVWPYSVKGLQCDQRPSELLSEDKSTSQSPVPLQQRVPLQQHVPSMLPADAPKNSQRAPKSSERAPKNSERAPKSSQLERTSEHSRAVNVLDDARYFQQLAIRMEKRRGQQRYSEQALFVAWQHAHSLTDHCVGTSEECGWIHVEAIMGLGKLAKYQGDRCCAAHLASVFLDATPLLRPHTRSDWHTHVSTQRKRCNEADQQTGNAQRKCFEMPHSAMISSGVKHTIDGAEVLSLFEHTDLRNCAAATDASISQQTLPLACAYGATVCNCAPLLHSYGQSHFNDLRMEPVATVAVLGGALDQDLEPAAIEMFHSVAPLQQPHSYLVVFRRHLEGMHGAASLYGGKLRTEQSGAELPQLVAAATPWRIGGGEDPRVVWHQDRIYVYHHQMSGSPAKVHIYLHDLKAHSRIELQPPEVSTSGLAPHGEHVCCGLCSG